MANIKLSLIDKMGLIHSAPVILEPPKKYLPQDCFTIPQHLYHLALQYQSKNFLSETDVTQFEVSSKELTAYLQTKTSDTYLAFNGWKPRTVHDRFLQAVKVKHFSKARQHILKIVGDSAKPDIFFDKRIFQGSKTHHYPFVNRCMDPFCVFGIFNQEVLKFFDGNIQEAFLKNTQKYSYSCLSFASGYLGRDMERIESIFLENTLLTEINFYFIDFIYEDYICHFTKSTEPSTLKEWINYEVIKELIKEFCSRLSNLFSKQSININLFFTDSADSFVRYASIKSPSLDIMVGEDYWEKEKQNPTAGYNTDSASEDAEKLMPWLYPMANFHELVKDDSSYMDGKHKYTYQIKNSVCTRIIKTGFLKESPVLP